MTSVQLSSLGIAVPDSTTPEVRPSAFAFNVHEASCSIWETPEDSATNALIAKGYEDEALAAYLSEMRPLYDAAKRCLGQLSGFLLLLQTARLERGREGLLLAAAVEQLDALDERLRAVAVPPHARRHHAAVSDLLERLKAVVPILERASDLIDPASPELERATGALFAGQRLLLALSVPDAGLAPVDFSAACCSCSQRSRT